MTNGIIEARGLPNAPLDAAALFHAQMVPAVRQQVADGTDCVILFDPASPAHHDWRLGIVRDLAREAPPARVNAIVAPRMAAAAIDRTVAYLRQAPGVTGQVLVVDANSPETD